MCRYTVSGRQSSSCLMFFCTHLRPGIAVAAPIPTELIMTSTGLYPRYFVDVFGGYMNVQINKTGYIELQCDFTSFAQNVFKEVTLYVMTQQVRYQIQMHDKPIHRKHRKYQH